MYTLNVSSLPLLLGIVSTYIMMIIFQRFWLVIIMKGSLYFFNLSLFIFLLKVDLKDNLHFKR